MQKYKIMPSNGIDYIIFATSVEVQGTWLMFYKKGELIHACSSIFTRFVSLTNE
jgi:hypothetical protein